MLDPSGIQVPYWMFHGAFHPQDGFLSTISYRAFPSVGPFWPNWRPQFAVQYKSANNKHGETVLCQSVFLPRLTTFHLQRLRLIHVKTFKLKVSIFGKESLVGAGKVANAKRWRKGHGRAKRGRVRRRRRREALVGFKIFDNSGDIHEIGSIW